MIELDILRPEVGGWARFRCADGARLSLLIDAGRAALQSALGKGSSDLGSPELAGCVELLKSNGLGFSLKPRNVFQLPLADPSQAEGCAVSTDVVRDNDDQDDQLPADVLLPLVLQSARHQQPCCFHGFGLCHIELEPSPM